jgi:Mg-chelatase subunit ChlD
MKEFSICLRRSALAILLLPHLVIAAEAHAQTGAASAEARAAQFVFVIDDSGSMVETDPNRLSVFAVQALLSMLDGRDEVSIVRLNGGVEGEQPPPIEPLSRNRKAMERLLDLGSGLAAYSGENTTCRSALEQVKKLFEAAYRPGVAQAVFFLTDGECTPAASERPNPAAFLQGLRSHAEGLFQFYLIRFQGEIVSPELPQFAQMTGGDVIETDSKDATRLLHAFATALSRSQGFEAEIVSPQAPNVAAHRGARRVRLLAVAPGGGQQLGLQVLDREGRPHRTLKQPRPGEHRFPGQEAYRFVAVDYKPTEEPVRLQVTGAGSGWKAVVLPEYRVSLRARFLLGGCDEGAQRAGGVVEAGSTICVMADLINEQGTTVAGDLTGQALQASLLVRPRGSADFGSPLPMEPVGDKARFQLERKLEETGDWIYQPVLSLGFGESRAIRSIQKTFQITRTNIALEPARLSFGTLRPGQEAVQSFKLVGSWPSTPVRIGLRDRDDVPSCVTFALNGNPEGKAQKIQPGQGHTLTLRVAPYCGPESFSETFSKRLGLTFEGLAEREAMIEFRLESKVRVPREIVLQVRDGEGMTPLEIQGNWAGDLPLKGSLASVPQGWPGERLTLAFSGAGIDRDESTLAAPFLLPHDGGDIRLRAKAHPCCASGSHRAEMRLSPARLEGYAPGTRPPDPLVVPLRVDIQGSGIWACYGYWILRGLLALLLLILALYIANMFRNTRLLKPARVAEKLVPLDWTAHGGTAEQKGHRTRVLDMVRTAVSWRRRWTAWLQANPLAFGLPGGSYHESLELYLQPHRDVSRSMASLVPQRRFPDKLNQQPEAFTGRLFATAQGGVSFWGVTDREGRIGRMTLEGVPVPRESASDPARRDLVKLRGSRLLRQPEDWETPEEGRPAGWLVG